MTYTARETGGPQPVATAGANPGSAEPDTSGATAVRADSVAVAGADGVAVAGADGVAMAGTDGVAMAAGTVPGASEAVRRPVRLRFGYGTNGFAGHRLTDALMVLADIGYDGVALTLDHCHLDPFAPQLARRTAALARQLAGLGLDTVVETGARYLLDPHRKHAPTLLDDARQHRIEYLTLAVRVAADLGSQAVSLWSGIRPAALAWPVAWDRLVSGCATVVEEADRYGVTLGFEPEPGMLVDTLDGYDRLSGLLGHPPCFGLTLDVGHCRCLEKATVRDCVLRAGPRLVNVQIEDMRRGVHEHLEFGAGEIEFPPVLVALRSTGYRGLVSVELPRHSHAAPHTAAASLAFLRAAATAPHTGSPA